jgi:hypothetical protein
MARIRLAYMMALMALRNESFVFENVGHAWELVMTELIKLL